MKRLAVFLGGASFGGRTYEKDEEVFVRPRDVQALLDSGAVRWADEGSAQPKRAKTRKRKRKA